MIVCEELNSNPNAIEWIGGVVEEGTREGEVSSSNPTRGSQLPVEKNLFPQATKHRRFAKPPVYKDDQRAGPARPGTIGHGPV